LDEPTTGLHFEDIRVGVINTLVDKEYDLIIEHNMDVIKLADYIIDIGPEGGKRRWKSRSQGTPEEIADNKKAIRKFLKRN
jgi:excinuclease ABC subunit A